MVSETLLDFYLNNSYNVILEGRRGVGKTSVVHAAFKRAGLNYLTFSGATMDPWVDFVGVPQKVTTEDGLEVIRLVRPEALERNNIEAIFIDEFNRSDKKIRNAVLELLQFKSINGKKFEHLKVVWAAINPPNEGEEEYDVEPLDPAQIDRFHALVKMRYDVSIPWFCSKFGEQFGRVACEWWKALPTDIKSLISPRRLEYALDMMGHGATAVELQSVLPRECNINKFVSMLSNSPVSEQLEKLKKESDEIIRQFFIDDNNYQAALGIILPDSSLRQKFIPFFPDERLSNMITSNSRFRRDAIKLSKKNSNVKNILEEIVKTGASEAIVDQIRKGLSGTVGQIGTITIAGETENFDKGNGTLISDRPQYKRDASVIEKCLDHYIKYPSISTYQRENRYHELRKIIRGQHSLPSSICRSAMSVIEHQIMRTHRAKITQKMPDLGRIVNSLLVMLNGNLTDQDNRKDYYNSLIRTYPKTMAWISTVYCFYKFS